MNKFPKKEPINFWAGRIVLVGVMKYIKHKLMDHEIFFKIFDGPQNIFWCSIFVILFCKLRGLEHKISKLVIKEIYEKQDMLNKSHPHIHSADIR